MQSYFDRPNHASDGQRGCGINRRNPGRMHIFEKYTFETSIVYTSLGYLELYFEEFGISPEQTFFHPDDGVFSSGTALFIRTKKSFHPERPFSSGRWHFFIRNGTFSSGRRPFSSGRNLQPGWVRGLVYVAEVRDSRQMDILGAQAAALV